MIPFKNRVWTHGNFHFIQPFPDYSGYLSAIDLYLDNNAFIELLKSDQILSGVKKIPGLKFYTVNPSLAFVEQWVSNDVFQQQSVSMMGEYQHEMIAKFMENVAVTGHTFSPDYIDLMIKNCHEQAVNARYMLGALFGYIAIIRSLQRRKMPFADRKMRFASIFSTDVPIFAGLIGLAAFTFYALENRRATDTSGNQLVSIVDRFFAPKQSEKEALSPEYLRNRAMDLFSFYMMPILVNAEVNKGAPAPIYLTADKFLATFPFRFTPPLRARANTSAVPIAVIPDGLGEVEQAGFLDTWTQLRPQPRKGPFPTYDRDSLLGNLNAAVSSILSEDDKAGFEAALRWAAPDF